MLSVAVGPSHPGTFESFGRELKAFEVELSVAKDQMANPLEVELVTWYQAADSAIKTVHDSLAVEKFRREIEMTALEVYRQLGGEKPTPRPDEKEKERGKRDVALKQFREAIEHGESLFLRKATPTPVPSPITN